MFFKLDTEKQTRILNAAYKEFSEQGYKHASTNRIVKEAEIGKGMLFYYFNSKKDLYNYLIENGADYVIKEYLSKIDERQTDFIEKYKQIARLKLDAYMRNPYIFNFLGQVYISKEDELPQGLENVLNQIREKAFEKIFQNIDMSLFREDVPPETCFKLIKWTLDGYEKELVAGYKGLQLSNIDMKPYWDEFFNYLDVLRKIYYK
jgi:AcrR family transcriptional regulator